MRKYFLSLVAMATMILFSGCNKNEDFYISENGDMVTFNIATPEMGTRAISDGTTVSKLYVAVYQGGVYRPRLTESDGYDINNKTATVSLPLVTGVTYDIVFWAQAEGAPYEFNATEGIVSVDYTDVTANNENLDAFYANRLGYEVKGPKTETVELTRPFAQLNVATLDYESATNSGINITQTDIKVQGVYTSFNLLNEYGAVTGAPVDIELDPNTIPSETLVVNGVSYKWLSMNYLLVNEKTTISATMATNNGNVTREWNHIPVQRNFRTNILGNILTTTTDFNVVIDEEFAGEEVYPDTDLENLYYAAANGGEVTLTEDITLTEPLEIIANATINLGGKTLTGSVTVADGVQATISNGKIINEDNSVSGITSNGDLTINNVEIKSARHALRIESGKVIINGGTYKVVPVSKSTLYALNVGDGASSVANVVIKGGTFIGPKGTMADSGGALTVKVGSSVKIEGGDFSGGKSNTLSSNGTITISGGSFDQDPTTFVVDGYQVILKDGKYYVVEDEIDAIATTTDQLKDAIEASEKEVYVVKGNYEFPDNNLFKAGQTIICEEGTVFTGNSKLNIKGSKVINATFSNPSGNAVDQTINGVFENCTFTGSNALRWCYAGETVEFINCVFDGDVYGVHFDGGANEVIFKNCVLYGWNSFGSALTSVSFYDSELYGNGSYALIRSFADLRLENCHFDIRNANHQDAYPEGVEAISPAKMEEINCEWVVSSQEQLVKATGIGSKVYLTDGEYEMPMVDLRDKKLTLVGSKDAIIDVSGVNANNQFVTGATLAFEGLTLNFGTVNYMGFANPASLTYKDCNINGLQFLYGKVSFEGCNFNSNGAEHSVWTYGATAVNFKNCKFTYGDRCINCYSDNDVEGGKQVVNFTNCEFATANTASKGAVEINSCFFSVGIEVNLTSCTAPAYGQMAYVSPWDSTNGAKTTINVQ